MDAEVSLLGGVSAYSTSLKLRQKVSEWGIEWGSPIIDLWCKISVAGSIEWVRLRIRTILISDGISLRSLDLASLRNTVTYKDIWKVSIKSKSSTTTKVVQEVFDAILKGTGTSFVTPLHKAYKILAKKFRKWSPNEESEFKASLYTNSESIWTISVVTRKFNALKWNSSEPILSRVPIGKPILDSTIVLDLKPGFIWQLNLHTNIPLDQLNRDHARAIRFSSQTEIATIFDWKNEILIWRSSGNIEIPPIRYATLLTGSVVREEL